MNHFIKKKIIAGAGGKEKPKPKAAVLSPPDLGRFEIASSYSIADIIDLISDGPIEGLVNQNGADVTNTAMLQAVYLDNTPIEISNDSAVGVLWTNSKKQFDKYIYSINSSDFNNRLNLFANRMQGEKVGIFYEEKLKNCFFSYEAGGAFDKTRRFAAITFPWLQSVETPVARARVAFTDSDKLNQWQPVFSNFFGGDSTPEYFNGGNIINKNLEDYDPYTLYYNQDVSVAKHRLYLKNKSGTNGPTPYYSNGREGIDGGTNQKYGGSDIEVHYTQDSLSSTASILRVLGDTLESTFGSIIYNNQKRALRAKLETFWTTYPLGTNDELVNKFVTNVAYVTTTKRVNGKIKTIRTPIQVGPNASGPAIFSNSSYPHNARPTDKCMVIIKIGNDHYNDGTSNYMALGTIGPDKNNSIYADDGITIDDFSVVIPNLPDGVIVHSFVLPLTTDWNETGGTSSIMNGSFYGAVVLEFPLTVRRTSDYTPNSRGSDGLMAEWNPDDTASHSSHFNSWKKDQWFFDDNIVTLRGQNFQLLFSRGDGDSLIYGNSSSKYNFSNILCEFKNGTEQQSPLDNFNKIYIDYEYGVALYGAFRKSSSKFIRRIQESEEVKSTWDEINNKQDGGAIRLNSDPGTAPKEGSSDVRSKEANSSKTVNFSDWQKESYFNEDATPFVHIIENPNVTSVYFTLGISSLKDTVSRTRGGNDPYLTAGEALPAILVIDAKWGKMEDGEEKEVEFQRFTIIAQIESQVLIDFGQPDSQNTNRDDKDEYDYVLKGVTPLATRGGPHCVNFELPEVIESEDVSKIKRFIRITKVSVETNSVLISRECSVSKVTEMIDVKLTYPFCALNGIKLDSRSFGSLPDRSYDCRLKTVKIPKNYKIYTSTNKDKRYKTKSQASVYNRTDQIYVGDWNGELVDGWTDNPAWILYDLLTSHRYGLGAYIDESQINIWELYKIGRFCDNVDEDGYFIGVPDGIGGLEPRYSCNIMFKDNIKVFDAINIVSNLFRGATFFSNSEIHFLDDRPRTPIALFSNSNVKDGLFNYTNNRKDEQFNTVEVVYLDRFDNFKTKIEFVEDEASLRKRGILKTTINTNGVTSRAMARRIGKHLIYQTIKENQSVEFKAGLESLLCRPGDLIIVEDEMKTRETNYGRVLDINLNNKSIYIENQYLNQNYSGKLIVYTPTGYATMLELTDLAKASRYRTDYFDLTGNVLGVPINDITGRYSFYEYVNQSTGSTPQYSAVYTGMHSTSNQKLFCYYNTGADGWVFATGKSFADDDSYDKMISNTGIVQIQNIDSTSNSSYNTGFKYSKVSSNKRTSPSGDISNNLTFTAFASTQGIVESEISTINYPQITTFNITGFDNQDYGANLYLNSFDPNINLLPFIKQGSPYRIERSGASDQIYKIASIREENQNEYTVIATKYDTGKYELIENFTAQDYLPDTYYAGAVKANNYEINQLSSPVIDKFITGNSDAKSFSLSGVWQSVANATGYEVSIYNSLAQYYVETITPKTVTKVLFSNLNTLGLWTLNVKAIGEPTYLESDVATTDAFVIYNGITVYDRPAISNFKIL